MSDFEPDDELRDTLRRAHPTRNEARSTLAANRTRMARARTRRRAAIGSFAAASFVVVGAVFAANSTSDTNVVDVVAPPSTLVTVSSTEPGERPSSTTAAPSSTSTSSTSTTRGSDQTTVAPSPTSSSTQPTTTPTAPVTSAGATRTTYSSIGGTIIVTHTATAISVEQITDVGAWTHTVNKQDPDDVEIEWRRSNPENQAKVRLRLIDGAIREEIE